MQGILFPRIDYGLPPCKVCLTSGVPIPSNVVVTSFSSGYVIITFDFNFTMAGEDHFIFLITNTDIGTSFTMRFQPNDRYAVPSIRLTEVYTIKITPVINDIQYTSVTTPEFSID